MPHLPFVFVPAEHLDEDVLEHYDVVNWAVTHLAHPNVVVLTEDDVYLLDYQSEVLTIVNEENGGMLQMFEDDWVIERDKLTRIQHRLAHYARGLPPGRVQQITHDVLRLAETALRTNKYLYFNF